MFRGIAQDPNRALPFSLVLTRLRALLLALRLPASHLHTALARAASRAIVIAIGLAAFLPEPSLAREAGPLAVIPSRRRAELGTHIHDAIARHSEATKFPIPKLEEERLTKLFDGEVVRFRQKWILSGEGEDQRSRHRALAYRLIPAPRERVWLAILDGHFPLDDRITEVRLEDESELAAVWYQHMDLPWPVANREWVIRLVKEVGVARAPGGATWEQSWRLVRDGEPRARDLAAQGRLGSIDLEKVEDARYLEANDGSWAIYELEDDLTLATYNVTVVLGGLIPEGLASRFATRALESLMDRIAQLTEKMPSHYVEGHAAIVGGDGQPIPFFAAGDSSGAEPRSESAAP